MRPLWSVWQPTDGWPAGVDDPLRDVEPCECLMPGPDFDAIERELGTDPTSHGEAMLRRCRVCGRIWLQLRLPSSGLWYRAVLDDEHRKVAVEAPMAVGLLADIWWHVRGGDGPSEICLPPPDVGGAGGRRPLYRAVRGG